jgi:hypothetical protein
MEKKKENIKSVKMIPPRNKNPLMMQSIMN